MAKELTTQANCISRIRIITHGFKHEIIKTNKNGKKAYQNLWDAANAILSTKFLAINAYRKKLKIST